MSAEPRIDARRYLGDRNPFSEEDHLDLAWSSTAYDSLMDLRDRDLARRASMLVFWLQLLLLVTLDLNGRLPAVR